MNRVILMGRLTRDPDIRYSQGENSMAIARFTLAVDRRVRRDADQTADFISCVAFGRTAEFMEKYMKQGSRVCVEGRIQTGSYVNRDGQKVYTTDVVVENAEFADGKASASSAPQQRGAYQQADRRQGASQQNSYSEAARGTDNHPAQDAAEEGFMDITDGLEDEGLPFN